MFEIKVNEADNKIEVFNISEFDFSTMKLSDPIEVEHKEYDSTLDALGLNVLIPTDDGEDFIYTHVSTSLLSDKVYSPETLLGRRYSELYSFAKSSVNWYKYVYETGEKATVYIYFYENGSLVSCLEQKVVLNDEELFVFMDDKSDLIKVKTQKSPFEASSLPKILVRKDGSVKINVAFESLINAREKGIKELTLDDLDKNELIYDDTNTNLKVSDIVKKIFDGESYQIGYNMRVSISEDNYSIVHGIARIVNYDNEPCVEFIILKELLDEELMGLTLDSDVNMDTVQEFTKSGFLYYNVKNNIFSWGKGVEDILEGPVPLDFNLIDVFDEVTIAKDLNRRGSSVDDISISNPQIRTDYKIKTFKGNIKYLDCIIRAIIEDGKVSKLLYFFIDVTDEVLRNYDLLVLRDTLNDVQSAADIGISYRDAEGNRVWTQGFYEIIERAPREDDKCKNLFKDYLNAEDYERIDKLVEELGPDEYLGDQILPITLYGGKVKYIKLNLRKIYDDMGNFVRLSEYTMDVTDEVLRNKEITELNATVEDVQSATSIGIHYVTPDCKYHWTPEYYNILEREPRPEDETRNIIYDVFLPEDKERLYELIHNLEPNEFLGGVTVPIKLESGKKKYVRINSHKIYDKNGKFIRRTGYTRDVTDEVLNNYELLSLRDTVEDVQEAASLGIHYSTPEGKYHWTPEYYRILEREARPDDINTHIVFDLLSDEDRTEVEELIEKLEPNELLGNIVKPITLGNGKKKYIRFNARKVYDDGKFIRKIGYTQDITEEVLRNMELSELNNTVKEVQEATLMGIHYVTPNGNYHWTPECYNILEREARPDDKYHNIFLDLLDEDDRAEIHDAIEKLGSNEILEDTAKQITLENGKKKYIQFNARKIYDEEGKFIRKIGYAKDVTRDVLKDQELFSLRETVEDVQAAIAIGIHYLSADGKYHWTPEYYRILEREERPDDENRNIIFDLLSDEDREEIEGLLNKLPAGEFLGNIVKPITLENGKVKHVNINGRKIYDKKGKFIRESGCIQDVSEFVEFENALLKADYEKTVLIKEVHHRVKNNLQTISSFISLEERFGTDLSAIVQKTQNRIRVLALIHEAIYAETDMKCVSIKQFIEQFDELLESIALDSDISFVNEVDDLNLNMDEVTPIVLIINELTTNSFKHAFTVGEHGEIYKALQKFEKDGKKYYRFHYKDNGPGLPEDFDIDESPSLGWSIIKALSAQLDGDYQLFNKGGFNFVLEFPLIRQN